MTQANGESPEGDSSEEATGESASRKRRKGLLGGILGAAKATSKHVRSSDAAMAARTCSTCGAGRPEGEDLRICAYCGARFMGEEVEGG